MSAALSRNPVVAEVWTPSEVQRLRGVVPAAVQAQLYWWACAMQEQYARAVLDAPTRAQARSVIEKSLPFIGQVRLEIVALLPDFDAAAFTSAVTAGNQRFGNLAAEALPPKYARAFIGALRDATGTLLELQATFESAPELAAMPPDPALLRRAVDAATLADAYITAVAFGVEGTLPIRSPRVFHWLADAAELAATEHALAVEALLADALARRSA